MFIHISYPYIPISHKLLPPPPPPRFTLWKNESSDSQIGVKMIIIKIQLKQIEKTKGFKRFRGLNGSCEQWEAYLLNTCFEIECNERQKRNVL